MTAESAPVMAGAQRPGIITFIGVLLYIKAALAAVASIAAFVARGSNEAAQAGLSDDILLTAGITEGIAALLLLLVAMNLMGGSRGARFFVALVVGIRLALVVWVMLTHHTGGYLWNGIIATAFALFILWALYGDQRSEEYFEGQR